MIPYLLSELVSEWASELVSELTQERLEELAEMAEGAEVTARNNLEESAKPWYIGRRS